MCRGTGKNQDQRLEYNESSICRTCSGMGIINDIIGLPPEKKEKK